MLNKFVFLIVLILLCPTAHASIQAEVEFLQANDEREATALNDIQEAGTAQEVIAFLNEDLRLPEKIKVVMGAEDGPLFDPELMEIWIPYSFVIQMKDFFAQDYSEDGVYTPSLAAQDVLLHTLFHEVGHALIEMLELPITGREEDAVDSLATIMLIELYDEGTEVALSAADAFSYEDEAYETDISSFRAEHSIDIQRYYSTLCLLYGSEPDDYKDLADELSHSTAETCLETYDRKSNSWLKLLEPYLVTKETQPNS